MVRLVHVPPSLAPDRGQLVPPSQLPGKQHLQRLSEAGLPAAVAADDHGQPRARLQAQGRWLPDPPEAADRERPQVGTRRFWRGRGRPVTGRPRRSLAAELRRQAFFTLKCCEQQIGCLLL